MAKYAHVVTQISESDGRLDDHTIEAELRNALAIMEDTQERKALVREAFDTVFGVLRGEREQPLQAAQFLNDEDSRSFYFIKGARRFLESQYLNIVENKVRSNPEKSQAGAVPSRRSLLEGFLNLFYNQKFEACKQTN